MNVFSLFQGLTMSPEQRARRIEMRNQAIERRLTQVTRWDSGTKWARELNLSAESYMAHRQATPSLQSLFQVEPTRETHPERIRPHESVRIISPCGQWMYCEKKLERGECLDILSGRKRGSVMFDGPVTFPAIHEIGSWRDTPWMSLTPNEIFTLRIGTKFAKGHVIVAGLGLGHQLIEVLLRKQVTKVTLVEKSQGLVHFVLPEIQRVLCDKLESKLDVVVGNAYELIPKMSGDVALIDIFGGYGGNTFPRCAGITKVWCWGAA